MEYYELTAMQPVVSAVQFHLGTAYTEAIKVMKRGTSPLIGVWEMAALTDASFLALVGTSPMAKWQVDRQLRRVGRRATSWRRWPHYREWCKMGKFRHRLNGLLKPFGYQVLRAREAELLMRMTETNNTQQRFRNALRDCKGMANVDIGANVGHYTILMARFANEVYAFEPDPFAIRELESITGNLKNVTIIESAVGVGAGDVVLYRSNNFENNPFELSQSSSIIGGGHLDRKNSLQVRQLDFVSFLDELKSDVGVVKIDAEGAEVAILEALLDNPSVLRRIRYIFVELHERFFPELSWRYQNIRKRIELRGSCNPVIDLNWH